MVVEKPFTVTSGEAEELIELARKQGVLLSVYHNRRWDNDFLTVRRLVNPVVWAISPCTKPTMTAIARKSAIAGGNGICRDRGPCMTWAPT